MRNRELNKQRDVLESLFRRTSEASKGDIEIQSHWAKYLCVLIAGFLENALSQLYSEFCHNAASEPVARFAEKVLNRIQNPKITRFVETASSFKKSWGEDLETFAEDRGRKEAINSNMTQRHRIAHGKSSDITIARVREYYERALELLEFVEDQLTE